MSTFLACRRPLAGWCVAALLCGAGCAPSESDPTATSARTVAQSASQPPSEVAGYREPPATGEADGIDMDLTENRCAPSVLWPTVGGSNETTVHVCDGNWAYFTPPGTDHPMTVYWTGTGWSYPHEGTMTADTITEGCMSSETLRWMPPVPEGMPAPQCPG